MNWIWNNKEWLFSGVGVLILLGLGRWLWKPLSQLFNHKPGPETARYDEQKTSHFPQVAVAESDSHPITNAGNLSLANIIEDISQRPPYQRPDAQKNYIGLPVTWQLRFRNVAHLPSTKLHQIHFVDEKWNSVTGSIDIDKYPVLKIARKDEYFRVSGKIINFAFMDSIELDFSDISGPLAKPR